MPELCPCLDCHYFSYHLLILQDQRPAARLRARLLDKIRTAEEDDGNGCLLLPKTKDNKKILVTYKCPFGCDATYSHGKSRNASSGHSLSVRVGYLLKLVHVYDTSGKEAALTLAQRSKDLEVSHLCHACTHDLCLEVTHFEFESRSTNNRRKSHQNGNVVCDCAEYGDKPCMTNGTIGERVFDDKGLHVGWNAKAKRGKRIKTS